MPTVDLNADMGESFGPWTMGDDTSLLKIVTSANIACGGHAGDADVMAQTMRIAHENGVGIGAHPGFMDLAGFGRNRMSVPRATLQNQVRYQVAASVGMARSQGATVRHLKLHGALANMASEDEKLAHDLYQAALGVSPDLIIMVLAATAQEDAVRALGCRWAGEIFADRAYNDDATLVDRSKPGAVIHDADLAGRRMVEMVQAGAILTEGGKKIETQIDTICLHGDTAEAVAIAASVRSQLEKAGIILKTFEGRRSQAD
ncbi:LamB/YcsF family protein [Sulfitobacter sp. JB4-11]|uniref:LamB/YcsF family protein n=1 Tax=Sulfitobacter rhodophyticola TaxID=3238304 RepID=UPI00351333EC